MATIVETFLNSDGEKVMVIDPQGATNVKLATANTYVDKNIIFQIPETFEVATPQEVADYLNIPLINLTTEEF